MPEAIPAAPAATSTPASAPAAAAAAPAAAPPLAAKPARPSVTELIAAATKALGGEQPAAVAAAPAEAKPPLPSTPEAPATEAVLAAQDNAVSMSTLIRQRNELADTVQGFEAERAKHRSELATAREKLRGEVVAELSAAAKRDPAAFLKALQADGESTQFARDIYLETADLSGLPPEQRAPLEAQRQMRQLQREMERLRAEAQQQQHMASLQAYRAQLATGLRELTDATPLVQTLAAENPQAALAMMENLAGALAQAQPELGIQSPAQLAARLEQTLGAELKAFDKYYQKRYAPAAPPAPALAPPAAPAAAPVAAPPTSISSTITDETPVIRRAVTEDERINAAIRAIGGR